MESDYKSINPSPTGVDSTAGKLPTVSTPDDPKGLKQHLHCTRAHQHRDLDTPPKNAPDDALVPMPCWLTQKSESKDKPNSASCTLDTGDTTPSDREPRHEDYATEPQATQQDDEEAPADILLLPQEATNRWKQPEKVVHPEER